MQFRKLAFLFVGLIFFSCGSTISVFNETAYQQATTLKVECLALMDMATEPYADHQQQVDNFIIQMDVAFEYAKGRPKNEISARQWEILKDPARNLAGGFFKRWKEDGQLSKVFIKETKNTLIVPAFDTIIELESGKLRSDDAKLIGE